MKEIEFKYALLTKVCHTLKPETPYLVVAYQIQADWSILYGLSDDNGTWKWIQEFEIELFRDEESNQISILIKS